MDIKKETLDLLQNLLDVKKKLMADLSPEETSACGTREQWAPKDVFAHLAAWDEHLAQEFAAAERGEVLPRVDDIDKTNEQIFLKHCDRSWAEVEEFCVQAHQGLFECLQSLDEDDFHKTDLMPWKNGRPLWRQLVGWCYTHPMMHLAGLHHGRGNTKRAVEIHEQCAESVARLSSSDDWRGLASYNLACGYALCGEKARAIKALREALGLNPGLTEWSKQDTDLASLRDDPEYLSLYAV